MASTPKILGQEALGATTLTDLYTVPASTSAVVSTVVVCNRGGSDTTFRLSVADAGAADTTKQYLYYDTVLRANTSFAITCGLTLEATDVIRAYAGNGNVSVNIFGVEVS